MSPSRTDFQDMHVLIVEDEWVIARETVRTFEQIGAVIVGPAGSIDQALDLIAATSRIDAAVLDINLRDELAYPVADALIARNIQFVFATGYDGAIIPPLYKDIVRLEKPVDPRRVAQALFAGI